ncbi:uncharacterized [Tachysurus ichikawai]
MSCETSGVGMIASQRKAPFRNLLPRSVTLNRKQADLIPRCTDVNLSNTPAPRSGAAESSAVALLWLRCGSAVAPLWLRSS